MMKAIYVFLFIFFSGSTRADETVRVLHIPDGDRPTLEILHQGRVFIYQDPKGDLARWLMAYYLTQDVRRKNYLDVRSSNNLENRKISFTSPVARRFKSLLTKAPWYLKLDERWDMEVRYGTFFDLFVTEIEKDFLKNSKVRISVGEKSADVPLLDRRHPLGLLNSSLALTWKPLAMSRMPTGVEFVSVPRR